MRNALVNCNHDPHGPGNSGDFDIRSSQPRVKPTALRGHLEGKNTAHFTGYLRYTPGPGGGGAWLQLNGA